MHKRVEIMSYKKWENNWLIMSYNYNQSKWKISLTKFKYLQEEEK